MTHRDARQRHSRFSRQHGKCPEPRLRVLWMSVHLMPRTRQSGGIKTYIWPLKGAVVPLSNIDFFLSSGFPRELTTE